MHYMSAEYHGKLLDSTEATLKFNVEEQIVGEAMDLDRQLQSSILALQSSNKFLRRYSSRDDE